MPMSHLSILPTVLRDVDILAASLEAMGFSPCGGGELRGFGAESKPVLLQVRLGDDLSLGWCRGADGSLALVGDLQRLSRCRSLPPLLARLTRDYAARDALLQAQLQLPNALIHCGA